MTRTTTYIRRVFFLVAAIISSISYGAAPENEADALARAKAANEVGDFATSLGIYRELESRGSGTGARYLGLMYWAGTGVAKDHSRACDLYAVAEQRGEPTGTELLGDCFYHGDGRDKDYAQSATFYRRASER